MRIRSIPAAIASLLVAVASRAAAPFRKPEPLVKTAFEGGRIDGMTFNLTREQTASDVVNVVMEGGQYLYRRNGKECAGAPVYALAS